MFIQVYSGPLYSRCTSLRSLRLNGDTMLGWSLAINWEFANVHIQWLKFIGDLPMSNWLSNHLWSVIKQWDTPMFFGVTIAILHVSQTARSPGHQVTRSPGHQVTRSPGHQARHGTARSHPQRSPGGAADAESLSLLGPRQQRQHQPQGAKRSPSGRPAVASIVRRSGGRCCLGWHRCLLLRKKPIWKLMEFDDIL